MYSRCPLGVTPSEFHRAISTPIQNNQARSIWRRNCFWQHVLFSCFHTQYQCVTDGQTDKIDISISWVAFMNGCRCTIKIFLLRFRHQNTISNNSNNNNRPTDTGIIVIGECSCNHGSLTLASECPDVKNYKWQQRYGISGRLRKAHHSSRWWQPRERLTAPKVDRDDPALQL